MDQANATKVRDEAAELSIRLLKTLRAHKKLTEGNGCSPVNDAILHAETAAELICSDKLNTDDLKEIRKYIESQTLA